MFVSPADVAGRLVRISAGGRGPVKEPPSACVLSEFSPVGAGTQEGHMGEIVSPAKALRTKGRESFNDALTVCE